ncbi:hypothetical protein ACF05P_28890, partial [Streptomyces omiyaensis]
GGGRAAPPPAGGGAPPPRGGAGGGGGGGGGPPPAAQPAIADPGQLPLRPRPSLQAVRGSESRTVDLTAEDDTQAMPRYAFDSLEAKLTEMERKLG